MARTRAAEVARESRERDLLEAALEVFVAKGYPATTISEIVRAAGVTQGTFYLYFENKAEIFSVLLREYRELLIADLFGADLDAVRTRTDWFQMANRIARFLVDHIQTHGDFIRLSCAEASTCSRPPCHPSAAHARNRRAPPTPPRALSLPSPRHRCRGRSCPAQRVCSLRASRTPLY